MSAMISLNSLKNDNKNEISQNVNINVNNNDTSNKDIKVSYNDNGETLTKTSTILENSKIFDYYENILPNINNEFYNNIIKVFAYYTDILNEGRFKKLRGQNVLFKKDYLNIIELLTKTYITNKK